MLTSILDSSPRRTPPTHSHTRRRNTSAPRLFCSWEKAEKKQNPSITTVYLLHIYFFQAHSMILLITASTELWVASICALLNAIHDFPARTSSFTLSCTRRMNQKSNQYFARSVKPHKHPRQSRFTAMAHSRFTPDWRMSVLREAFTAVLHLTPTSRSAKMAALVEGKETFPQ